MGEIKTYKCYKCGNTIEIKEGIGFAWCPTKFNRDSFYPPKKDSHCFNLYDKLDKDMLDEIHEFIRNTDTINVENAHIQPYICKKCGKVESNIYFKITDLKTGKTYSPKYKCECGNRLKKLTTKELKHLCCNKCGVDMEEVAELQVLWD